MQSSRDSSLWRSLAVAVGDGLAFGAGVIISQAAGRQLTAHSSSTTRSDSDPLAGRVDQIEQNLKRIERVDLTPAGSSAVDQKVLDAILGAIEARITEHTGQVERKLADLDARIAIELRSLDQQDNAIARNVSEDIQALHRQMVGLNREFGEAVAQIVADQVGSQVDARMAALEESLAPRIALVVEGALESRLAPMRREFEESIAARIGEQVAAQIESRTAAFEESMHREVSAAVESAVPVAVDSRVPAAMNASVGPLEQQLRAEIAEKELEITELRQRIADTDTNVLDLVLGIGEICRKAAAKISPPEELVEPEPTRHEPPAPQLLAPVVDSDVSIPVEMLAANGIGHGSEAIPEPELAAPVPGLTQEVKPSRLWRVPLVSSVVLATGSLVLRHFLY
jgi:hypothetical protein